MHLFCTQRGWLTIALIGVVAAVLIFAPALQSVHAQGTPDINPNDPDQDNILTPNDNCPTTFNPDQKDADDNDIGDKCDPDQGGTPNQNLGGKKTQDRLRSEVAEDVGGPFASGVIWFLKKPIEFVIFLLKFIVSWAADILNAVFGVQTFLDVPVVEVGWALARDLANILFIAILLVIAFATILRIQSYGMKQLLPRLIIIALLVNFSLLFAGIVIDFGTDMGFFFVSGGTPGEQGDVGDAVIGAMGLQRAAGVDGLAQSEFANIDVRDSDGLSLAALVRLFMQAVFLLIAAFILVAMAGMLFIRIPVLWVLLMFLPLVLVASIVPAGRGIWKQWFSKFTDWALFPALLGFFVYFAILAGQGLSRTAITDADFGEGAGMLGFTLNNLFQYAAVIAILFFGLIQSKKMGIAGAGYAMGIANKAKDVTLNKIKGGAGAAVRPVKRKAAEKMERIPLAGRMVGGPGAARKRRAKAMKDARRDLSGRSDDDLRAIMNMTSVTESGKARRAEAMKMLAEKGKLQKEDKKYFGDFVRAGGSAKDVLQRMPHWVKDEKIQSSLAAHPATEKDWRPITDLESGSDERREKTRDIFKKKFMAKKPKDFANVNKRALEDDDIRQWYREEFRDQITELKMVDGKLQEQKRAGFLSASHLNAAINENPSLYYEVTNDLRDEKARRGGDYDGLKESVRKHLEYGASALATPEEPGEESPPPSGGGGGEGEGGGS